MTTTVRVIPAVKKDVNLVMEKFEVRPDEVELCTAAARADMPAGMTGYLMSATIIRPGKPVEKAPAFLACVRLDETKTA